MSSYPDGPAFHALCAAHDWYYNYSDDHKAWERGRAQADKLTALAASHPALAAHLDSWRAAMFGPIESRKPRPTEPPAVVGQLSIFDVIGESA